MQEDERTDSLCRKAVKHIVARLTDPNAPRPAELGGDSGAQEPFEVVVPAHLQDLQEGDLPENQRVAVLDQIAVFREASARRDREKKRVEDERDRYKQAQNMDSRTADYGYGNSRGLQQQTKQRQWGSPQNQTQTPQAERNGRARDPQGYDSPVNFVKAQTVESKEQSARTDEEEEMMRQQRKIRERDEALREVRLVSNPLQRLGARRLWLLTMLQKERRVESQEWKRVDGLNRELAARKSHAEWEERHRAKLEDELRHWDDDEKEERGKELFYVDRSV